MSNPAAPCYSCGSVASYPLELTPGYPPADGCLQSPNSHQQIYPGETEGYPHKGIIHPPVAPGWEEQSEPAARLQIPDLVTLTVDVVREVVYDYVSCHAIGVTWDCYGLRFSNGINIENIETRRAFHYILQSFTEKRECAWKFDPYDGEAIDGPENGPISGPWDVHAKPEKDYKGSKVQIEVPHSAFVKPCHTCNGNGRVRCHYCTGKGCAYCHASGQEKCKTCNTKGHLKGYLQLTVTWTNHYDDYLSETEPLPKTNVRRVSGTEVFDEERPRVRPLSTTGDSGVDNASKDLVSKHSQMFTNEHILKQNHSLRIIPVTRVNYEYKGKQDEFYVYGQERKVYFDENPDTCCCSIL